MKMILTLVLFICCPFNIAIAQSEIKRIIYEDLLALNEIYDGCIIQFEQEKWIFKDNDTIREINTIATLVDSSESRVLINKIDSVNQFYFVEIKFDLISKSPYFNLFSENIFNYVLYKDRNHYYKIDGFLISEILFTTSPPKLLKGSARINAPNKFMRHLKNRNIPKLQKYLSVSVLESIRNSGFYISDKPYVKDKICH